MSSEPHAYETSPLDSDEDILEPVLKETAEENTTKENTKDVFTGKKKSLENVKIKKQKIRTVTKQRNKEEESSEKKWISRGGAFRKILQDGLNSIPSRKKRMSIIFHLTSVFDDEIGDDD